MRNFFDGEKYRTAYKSRAFSRLFYRMKNERSTASSFFVKGGSAQPPSNRASLRSFYLKRPGALGFGLGSQTNTSKRFAAS